MTELDKGLDGVILAAGRGTRMQPFSHHYPKPLLPILNEPLMHHQIRYLKSLGVERVIVVIGHLGNEIALDLGRGEALGVEIEYVEQRDSLGIGHAVMQLESMIHRPFALLLGDIYFEPRPNVNPVAMLREQGASGFISVHLEPNPEAIRRNFAVYIADDKTVHRVVEKQRFPKTQWKGNGLYLFDVSFFDALRRTPRTAGRDEYEITDAIQIYIDDGAKILADTVLEWDINLTFPYDLLHANLRALGKRQDENLIAPDAWIHKSATLSHCVVGPGAVIDAPISIRQTLLMKEATVTANAPLDRAIVTKEKLVDCRFWIDENGKPLDEDHAHVPTV